MMIKPVTVAVIVGVSLIVVALWVGVVVIAWKQGPSAFTLPTDQPRAQAASPTPAESPTPTATPEETEAQVFKRAAIEAALMFADLKAKSPALQVFIDRMEPYADGNILNITVTQNWHVQHYQLRLQFA